MQPNHDVIARDQVLALRP